MYAKVETMRPFIDLLVPRLFVVNNANYEHDVAKLILKYMVNVLDDDNHLWHAKRAYKYISKPNIVKPLGDKRDKIMKFELPTTITYMPWFRNPDGAGLPAVGAFKAIQAPHSQWGGPKTQKNKMDQYNMYFRYMLSQMGVRNITHGRYTAYEWYNIDQISSDTNISIRQKAKDLKTLEFHNIRDVVSKERSICIRELAGMAYRRNDGYDGYDNTIPANLRVQSWSSDLHGSVPQWAQADYIKINQ